MKVPVVLLPGLLCDERLFSRLTYPNDWEVRSSALPAREDFVAMAAEVLRTAPPRFVLGGLSLGGLLAFEVFRQAPERVLGVLILNSNFAAERAEVSAARNALVVRAREGEFARITPEVLLPKMVFPENLSENVAEVVNRMAEDVGVECFAAHARALETRPDAEDVLATIDCPTLIVCGRNDALCPVTNHLGMAAAIAECSLHVINRCGHLSSLERPGRVSAYIAHWWDVYGESVRTRLTKR